MSAIDLQNILVQFSKIVDIHDFKQVLKDVSGFFYDEPKQNEIQYDVPEILKDLPVVEDLASDPKLLNEMMEIEPSEADDVASLQGNTFRRIEIVEINHQSVQIETLDTAPVKHTFTISNIAHGYDNADFNQTFILPESKSEFVISEVFKDQKPLEVQVIVEDAPIVQVQAPVVQDAPIVLDAAPIAVPVLDVVPIAIPAVDDAAPIAATVLDAAPIAVPVVNAVAAQLSKKLPASVINVNPERGPIELLHNVYLVTGVKPVEAPHFNKNLKATATMEVIQDDHVQIVKPNHNQIQVNRVSTDLEKAVNEKAAEIAPLVVAEDVAPIVIAEGVAPIVIAEDVAPLVVAKDVAPLVVAEDVAPLVVAEDVIPLVVAEDVIPLVVAEDVAPLVVAEGVAPIVVVEEVPVVVEVAPIVVAEKAPVVIEDVTPPVDAEEVVEEIAPIVAEQQKAVDSFVADILADKIEVEVAQVAVEVPVTIVEEPVAVEVPVAVEMPVAVEPVITKVVSSLPITRPVFKISAEQFAEQASKIKDKAHAVQVEGKSAEVAVDEPNLDLKDGEVFISLPPPIPPSMPSFDKASQATKIWAKVETTGLVQQTSKPANPVRVAFAIQADQFAAQAKKLKSIAIQQPDEPVQVKTPVSGNSVGNILIQAIESKFGTSSKANSNAAPTTDEEEIVDEWQLEERAEALIASNEKLLHGAVEHKIQSKGFQTILQNDLKGLVYTKLDAVKTIVELYHKRVLADVNVEHANEDAVSDKIAKILEKVEILVNKQLSDHAMKTAQALLEANLTKLVDSHIDTKKIVDLESVDKLITQFDQDLNVKRAVYDKVNSDMDKILNEEAKYLSKAEGIDLGETFCKNAVDQIAKNLMTDKTTVNTMVYDLHHEAEDTAESVAIAPHKPDTSLTDALTLRRIAIAHDDDSDSEESDWGNEDEPPVITPDEVTIFVDDMVNHKPLDAKPTIGLSPNEEKNVALFVKDITQSGFPLTIADAFPQKDSIPGLQEGEGSKSHSIDIPGTGSVPMPSTDVMMMTLEPVAIAAPDVVVFA
jgi:hypothetical protein